MILPLDTDAGYEAFQFWNIALAKTNLPGTLPRMMQMHGILKKFVPISKAVPGGRVLLKECDVELTDDERTLLLDAIANTSWVPEVFPHVRRACEMLGADFEG